MIETTPSILWIWSFECLRCWKSSTNTERTPLKNDSCFKSNQRRGIRRLAHTGNCQTTYKIYFWRIVFARVIFLTDGDQNVIVFSRHWHWTLFEYMHLIGNHLCASSHTGSEAQPNARNQCSTWETMASHQWVRRESLNDNQQMQMPYSLIPTAIVYFRYDSLFYCRLSRW